MSYSIKEEYYNTFTHFLGIIIGIIILPILIFQAYQTGKIETTIGMLMFSGGWMMVYIASTLYHYHHSSKRRKILKKIDHIAIYFLIAGSHAAFLLPIIDTWHSQVMMGILWILVLLGTLYKIFASDKYPLISLILYMAMGWLGVVTIWPMLSVFHISVIVWIGVGGVFYTLGAYFYNQKSKDFSHAIWHVLVLLGSISHYIAAFLSIKV